MRIEAWLAQPRREGFGLLRREVVLRLLRQRVPVLGFDPGPVREVLLEEAVGADDTQRLLATACGQRMRRAGRGDEPRGAEPVEEIACGGRPDAECPGDRVGVDGKSFALPVEEILERVLDADAARVASGASEAGTQTVPGPRDAGGEEQEAVGVASAGIAATNSQGTA